MTSSRAGSSPGASYGLSWSNSAAGIWQRPWHTGWLGGLRDCEKWLWGGEAGKFWNGHKGVGASQQYNTLTNADVCFSNQAL